MTSQHKSDNLQLIVDDRIDDYLDHLCTPLIGTVPYQVRKRLRLEAEEHILQLIVEFSETGLSANDSLVAGLKEHGEPWRIGQAYVDEWLRSTSRSAASRLIAPYLLHGFAWCGLVSVPVLLMVEQSCVSRYNFPTESVSVVVIVAPLIVGVLTGITSPCRPISAVCVSMGIFVLVSAIAGAIFYPDITTLRFAGVQALYWTPVASICAWATAYFRLLHQRQRFFRRFGILAA